MGKRTKAHPFGGNPYGAPSLPFNLKMPDPFAGARDFDVALGLEQPNSFDMSNSIRDDFGGSFGNQPSGRTSQTKRKRKFSVERQERLLSGQAPLDGGEQYNMGGDRDPFGQPRTQ